MEGEHNPEHHHHHSDHVHAEHSHEEVVKIKMTKKNLWIAGIVLLLAILISLALYFKAVFVAAVVNGHIISRLSVVKELEKQGGKNTLDTIIDNRLIQDDAKAKKVTVSDDEINKEIATYEDRMKAQGSTLDAALAQAGLTKADLKDRVLVELELEKLLGDQIKVTDADVDQYIKDNKVTLPAGQEAATKDQVRAQLKQTKLSTAAPAYIADLRTKGKIKTFVNY